MTTRAASPVAHETPMRKMGNLTDRVANAGAFAEPQREFLEFQGSKALKTWTTPTTLVWETEQERPTREIAVEQKENPFKGHKMLLDGQQRLTSLAAILLGEPVNVRGKKRPIEILFNLDHPDGPPKDVMEVEDDTVDTEDSESEDDEEVGPNLPQRLKLRTFVVASGALLVDPHWVKVSNIFDTDKTDAQILKPLVKSFDDPLFDKYSKRLQAVRKIREYPYVMHVLDKGLSYEEVAEIFVRVNSLGIKLRGSDLALAQILPSH